MHCHWKRQKRGSFSSFFFQNGLVSVIDFLLVRSCVLVNVPKVRSLQECPVIVFFNNELISCNVMQCLDQTSLCVTLLFEFVKKIFRQWLYISLDNLKYFYYFYLPPFITTLNTFHLFVNHSKRIGLIYWMSNSHTFNVRRPFYWRCQCKSGFCCSFGSCTHRWSHSLLKIKFAWSWLLKCGDN